MLERFLRGQRLIQEERDLEESIAKITFTNQCKWMIRCSWLSTFLTPVFYVYGKNSCFRSHWHKQNQRQGYGFQDFQISNKEVNSGEIKSHKNWFNPEK